MRRVQDLQELTDAHGVSGFEQRPLRVFRSQVEDYCDELISDALGSLAAVRRAKSTSAVSGSKATRLLIDAHIDEIGFFVRYISPDGLVYMQGIGRWDAELAVAQRVVIHTNQGPVVGVVGRKASHLLSTSPAASRTSMVDIWIDIGAGSALEAKKLVQVGDWGTYEANLQHLSERRVVAKALDNRAGVFVLTEVLRMLSEQSLEVDLYCLASVQEEIGCNGIAVAASTFAPEVGLVVDTIHTSDYPGLDKRMLGEISLGAGPVIVRGPNTNEAVFRQLVSCAKEHSLSYQLQASSVIGGTNASELQVSRNGVATGVVALPVRYMHSAGEVVDLGDIEQAARLLACFARACKPGQSWNTSII